MIVLLLLKSQLPIDKFDYANVLTTNYLELILLTCYLVKLAVSSLISYSLKDVDNLIDR